MMGRHVFRYCSVGFCVRLSDVNCYSAIVVIYFYYPTVIQYLNLLSHMLIRHTVIKTILTELYMIVALHSQNNHFLNSKWFRGQLLQCLPFMLLVIIPATVNCIFIGFVVKQEKLLAHCSIKGIQAIKISVTQWSIDMCVNNVYCSLNHGLISGTIRSGSRKSGLIMFA